MQEAGIRRGFHSAMIPASTRISPLLTRTYILKFPDMSSKNISNDTKSVNGGLTHFDEGGQAHMVDVGAKAETHRVAIASGVILMKPTTWAVITSGTAKKGDVLGIARIAAIMGAKRTADLIPLCHPLALTRVAVEFTTNEVESSIMCNAQVETYGKTGVEMEALTAVQIGLLTIYDMCKAIDRGMTITEVRVMEKLGGKSGHWKSE